MDNLGRETGHLQLLFFRPLEHVQIHRFALSSCATKGKILQGAVCGPINGVAADLEPFPDPSRSFLEFRLDSSFGV